MVRVAVAYAVSYAAACLWRLAFGLWRGSAGRDVFPACALPCGFILFFLLWWRGTDVAGGLRWDAYRHTCLRRIPQFSDAMRLRTPSCGAQFPAAVFMLAHDNHHFFLPASIHSLPGSCPACKTLSGVCGVLPLPVLCCILRMNVSRGVCRHLAWGWVDGACWQKRAAAQHRAAMLKARRFAWHCSRSLPLRGRAAFSALASSLRL